MKKFASIIAIMVLGSACQTPAYAEVPPNPLPEMMEKANQEPKRFSLDEETVQTLLAYLNRTQVLYSVKCSENKAQWFCDVDPLIERIRKNIQEVKPEVAPKPEEKAK